MIYTGVAIILIAVIVFSLRFNWWRVPVAPTHPRILMYHMVKEQLPKAHRKHNKWRVRPDDFERQMKWLHDNGWHSYTISELVNAKEVPERSFVITFDDGYYDNYTYVFPLLKKYSFKATIYLVPGYTENSWEKSYEGNFDALLTQDQITEMQKSDLIEFGSHTLNHKNLLSIDDCDAYNEIVASKIEVEKMIGHGCQSFAYPYGKYTENVINMVGKAGYRSAVVVKRGIYEPQTPLAIRRIGVIGTESFFDFYLKITRVRNKF